MKRKAKLLGPVCPEHGALVESNGEKAILRPLKEGEDLRTVRGEPVHIEGRDEDGSLVLAPLFEEGGQSGPAQVATKGYRDGWDRVFKKSSELN